MYYSKKRGMETSSPKIALEVTKKGKEKKKKKKKKGKKEKKTQKKKK